MRGINGVRRPSKIIAVENSALDRWGKGDPKGYLEIHAPDITYDRAREKRADGIQATKNYYFPSTGKIKIEAYERHLK